MTIQNIIRQHSKDVAVVFKQLGITAPVTPKEVIFATILYPDKFINSLAKQIDNSSAIASFEGEENPHELANVTVTATRPSTAAKNTLTDILNSVMGGVGAYLGAKNAGTRVVTPEPLPKKVNWYLVGGIAIVVALVIYIVSTNKK